MSDTAKREMMIGAFVLAGLCLVGLMFWVLERQAFQPKYRISAEFTYAGGIREGTPVHMAGKPVGQVKMVKFRDEAGQVLVDVVMEIEAGYKIKSDSQLTVGSIGLLGEKILEFSLGSVSAGYLPQDGKARVKGTVPPGLEDLQKTLSSAVDDLRGTIVKVNSFLDSLNDPEFKGALKGAVVGVEEIAKKGSGAVDKIDTLVSGANDFVGKANGAMDKVDKIVSTADGVIRKLDELAEKLNGLSDEAKAQITRTGDNVDALAKSLEENSKQLTEILASLDKIAKSAAGGEGTIGHVLGDKGTARKLDDLLVSLRTASDSLTETSDFLRKHPGSLIWGGGEDTDTSDAGVDWRDRK